MVFGIFDSFTKGGNDNDAGAIDRERQRPPPGFRTTAGSTCVVTGSNGLCGARLVEMLLERGAARVVAFDVSEPDAELSRRFRDVQERTGGKITLCCGPDVGDLTSDAAVENAFRLAAGQVDDDDAKSNNNEKNGGGSSQKKKNMKKANKIDVVYHIGALVGPFFDRSKYHDVNHYGTIRIIDNCRKYRVPRLVYSSSPSTRFTGADVTGQTEDELPMPTKWLAMYAEAKAYGEMAVSEAALEKNSELLTVSVAPHQVYGPYDKLFLPSLLETAGNGRLRIFGKGDNKISVTYVDNYCHGLICGADALEPNSPVLGKFYVVTDPEPVLFWKFVNEAVVAMGFTDLYAKFHLPVWFLYGAAYVANLIGWLTNRKLKLNPFNVRMLTIHRYFSIENAKRDLKYEPVVSQKEAWSGTIEWFKEHWLPGFVGAKANEDDSIIGGVTNGATTNGSTSNKKTN